MTIKTDWHPGTERPKKVGKYFVIAEANCDVGKYKKGDVELSTDVWLCDGPYYGFWYFGVPGDSQMCNILWWSLIPDETPDDLPVGVRLDFVGGERVSDE